jgi:hypothetical protein
MAAKELDALLARADQGGKVILPIWHNITYEDVKQHSSFWLEWKDFGESEENIKESKYRLTYTFGYQN